jgi:hypothetical protein
MDDTFVIWPHGPDRLQNFFIHLNSLRSSTQFSVEVELDCMIPFMDILVIGKGIALATKVYRNLPILTNIST